jgi:probable rRNA maturation factor
MILLDPDLDAELAPTGPSSARPGVRQRESSSKSNSEAGGVPSVRALAGFLAKAQEAVRLKGKVTVLLTTDTAIRRLNRQFRGKNTATDVLSFPAEGVGAEGIAGDLAISLATAGRQAELCGHSLGTEIKVLILHGVLHLAGYDHETDDGRMARREQALRKKLGLPTGLIERAGNVPSEAKASRLQADARRPQKASRG